MVGLGDLPSELAIVIFGFLEPFPEALHRCALVSRAFVHPCQSLLLSNTLVDWREKKIENEPPLCRDIETFAHQLESSPHFNLIIRRLTFQPYPGSGWYDVDTSLFIKVLNQLRNLQALTLRFLTFSKQASFDVGTLRPYAERHQLDKLEVELVNFQDFGTFNNIMSTFAKIRVFDIERSFSPLGSQLPDPDAYAFETSTTSPASHVYPLNTSELRICTSGQNSLFRCLSRLIHASQTNPEVLMLRTRSSRTLDMSCKALIDQLGPTLRIFMVDFLDDGYNPSRNSAGRRLAMNFRFGILTNSMLVFPSGSGLPCYRDVTVELSPGHLYLFRRIVLQQRIRMERESVCFGHSFAMWFRQAYLNHSGQRQRSGSGLGRTPPNCRQS